MSNNNHLAVGGQNSILSAGTTSSRTATADASPAEVTDGMNDQDSAGRGLAATEPSVLDRVRRYRRSEGSRALMGKMADVALRTGLTYAALATYYPSVAIAALRWKLRPTETVIRRIEGDCRHDGGRFAIFLVYQPIETPWYVRNALEALREAGVNVLLVFNHALHPDREAYFRCLSYGILIRNNAGLDIGGYRDGYLALRDDPQLERLLFLNDSVYFFQAGLTEFFDRLMGSTADVAAPFENRQHHYHIQSFCLAISGEMVRHPSIRAFFDNYLPINSRRWAIQKGEVALSHLLTATTDRIEILYRVEDLLAHETSLPTARADDLTQFLPILLRKRYEWM